MKWKAKLIFSRKVNKKCDDFVFGSAEVEVDAVCVSDSDWMKFPNPNIKFILVIDQITFHINEQK